jgi:hypothetical protein
MVAGKADGEEEGKVLEEVVGGGEVFVSEKVVRGERRRMSGGEHVVLPLADDLACPHVDHMA